MNASLLGVVAAMVPKEQIEGRTTFADGREYGVLKEAQASSAKVFKNTTFSGVLSTVNVLLEALCCFENSCLPLPYRSLCGIWWQIWAHRCYWHLLQQVV